YQEKGLDPYDPAPDHPGVIRVSRAFSHAPEIQSWRAEVQPTPKPVSVILLNDQGNPAVAIDFVGAMLVADDSPNADHDLRLTFTGESRRVLGPLGGITVQSMSPLRGAYAVPEIGGSVSDVFIVPPPMQTEAYFGPNGPTPVLEPGLWHT